eukprot:CCRYP_011659-RA/>CCRYP_011659-RA protein AED:0.83 eAED:0.83 QI:0/0/0/0.5/1/1/2/0/595
MRWLWVVDYLCSLPRRCFLFVKDILLDDPSLHLHAALDDLHQTASIEPDPFDSVLSSWVLLSGGDYSLSPVVDSSITQWDSVLSPPPVDISFQRIFGRHSWRLRRHFRHVAQCVTRQQDRLMSLTPTSPSPPAPSAEPDFVPSDLDKFLSSFHPAIAGIRMLTLERVDRLRFRHVSRCPSVSVSLRSCHYASSDVQITDLSSTNKVCGKGIITWRVLDVNGKEVEIKLPGYHVPSASVRLLSPQCLLSADSIGGGHGTQDATKYRFRLNNGIVLDAPYGRANLPVLPLSTGSDKELGFWARCFSFTASDNTSWSTNLLAAGNTNLSPAQKELLLWHYRLSHAGLSSIHNLLRTRRTPPVRSASELVPLSHGDLLPCKYKPSSSATDGLLCAACQIAKAKRRRPQIHSTIGSVSPTLSSLKAGHTSPGDCISCDHYISPTPGRVVTHSGHSSTRHGYVGGTIWVDHASQWIFHSPQHSLNAADTLRGKLLLEREAADVGATIRSIHTDNGVFNSKLFREHCTTQGQKLRFSGVGAHHQNGVAENAIRTISNMARANLIHASLRWPERSLLDLWPFAMSYAIWVHNRLPPHGYGLSP